MRILILAVVCVTRVASAEPLLSDTFNGNAIDTSKWTVITPISDSHVAEVGGNAVLTNRGWLLSARSLPASVDIVGRMKFSGSTHDVMAVVTRSAGTYFNPWRESDWGMKFQTSLQDDSGGTSNNIVIFRNMEPGQTALLAQATYPLLYDTYFDFRITDNGTDVAFFINDLTTPLVTARDSTVLGDRIALYNREGGGNGNWISNGSVTKVDFIEVNAVPEIDTGTGGVAVSLLLATVGLIERRLRRPGG